MKGYRTVEKESETELVINKSRFIGRCYPVEGEEQALSILNGLRKRHWDASHNCYAYRIEGGPARFSDDGEPGGTAGMPMMEVLRARDVTNVLCVVTRYFGGVLLGAGGLVRAYSRSAADAVSAAGIVALKPGVKLEMRMDYSRYGALEGYVRQRAQVQGVEFAGDVRMEALIAREDCRGFIEEVVERSDGRCRPREIGEGYLRVSEI